jgi:hypothetical protein
MKCFALVVNLFGKFAKPVPDFLAVFACNRTNIFLPDPVKVLKLPKRFVNIGFIDKFLNPRNDFLLQFKIVAKVNIARFAVEVKVIIKVLDVEVIIVPDVVVFYNDCSFGRDRARTIGQNAPSPEGDSENLLYCRDLRYGIPDASRQ